MLTPANIRDTWVLVASVGGAGFLKPAPGTWGSAAGAALWWQLAEVSLITQVLCVFAAVALGLWATWRIALTYGVDDDQAIVIDELAGVWLTLLPHPRTAGFSCWGLACSGCSTSGSPGPSAGSTDACPHPGASCWTTSLREFLRPLCSTSQSGGCCPRQGCTCSEGHVHSSHSFRITPCSVSLPIYRKQPSEDARGGAMRVCCCCCGLCGPGRRTAG